MIFLLDFIITFSWIWIKPPSFATGSRYNLLGSKKTSNKNGTLVRPSIRNTIFYYIWISRRIFCYSKESRTWRKRLMRIWYPLILENLWWGMLLVFLLFIYYITNYPSLHLQIICRWYVILLRGRNYSHMMVQVLCEFHWMPQIFRGEDQSWERGVWDKLFQSSVL